ncbi:MAG: hypothetical protein KIS67_01155 [Verrucomicrobiae bacterium]|nr:hypothetical protein [Verrucomicrobiae bacterium]
MKTLTHVPTHWIQPVAFAALFALVVPATRLAAEPAEVLFEDHFEGGIPGWTAVQPAGAYIDGPMLWVFDAVSKSFGEHSNIYTDSSTASTSRRAVMLISDTVAPTNFAYTARVTAGDDDGFGLIWGYEGESTFYRITFAWQNRFAVGWPFQGVIVDRVNDGAITDLHGPDNSFIPAVNRPFDVSIGVTNGRLTVVIADDPLGTIGGPFIYNTVTDLPLPTELSAPVGIFSWGQAGNNPRAFRIQDPTLNGVDLSAAAATQVLNNWSFLVTPREDGLNTVNTGGVEPLWGQALGINGDRKAMIQNSDSYNSTDNNANGVTNFIAPSAVAGDVNWTNYVVSTRFISSDNDGFGLLLRYQNETNFYRIAFRNQNAQTGIRRGLTVQKNVDQVFDQVYSNGVAGFIPPINVPFDVHAAIRGDILQIIAINNPDSAPLSANASGGTGTATATATGPIDVSLSTIAVGSLDHGKIGIISWAQYGDNNLPNSTAPDDGTAVDSVVVRKVNGEGLFVSSPYGMPSPPVGLNDFAADTPVTATVDSSVVTAPGVRQVSTGWTGVGSVPSAGEGNEVEFTLTQLSSISWIWKTQYQLTTNSTPGGTVSSTLGPWIDANASVTVNAANNSGYVFVGWSGDSISASPELTFPMTRPIALTAHFAVDSDNDGLPDEWEYRYFGKDNLSEEADGNPDLDDADNITEFRRGSNPAYAEGLVLNDGLLSQWINEADDRALPGWFVVTNFGSGFRGLWENSNQNRGANSAGPNDAAFISTTSYATNASFQGPALVVRSNVWNPDWASTFSLSAEYSVGDNDGLSLYFRYLDKSNWYRVTVCGELTSDPTRPLQGVTLQKRTNGWFSAITPTSEAGFFYTDPLDITGYKRFRVTVNGDNDTFEVRVIGWNVFLSPPDWDPSSEVTLTFTDADLPTGRIGIGPWGMAGFGAWNSTTNNPSEPGVQANPVGSGLYMDNIVLQVSGTNAFVEDWETAAIHTDLPAGWENPYAAEPVGGLFGDWNVSGHGTIANFTRAFGTAQSGTLQSPNADGEGPMLLAPALTNLHYVLELGIHPLDDGGMGFVYDYADTDNFARVLFNAQVPLAGQMAQGLNVSRKSGGVWTTIAAGDNAFIYTPGRRFATRFANNNGIYTLSAWNVDAPGTVYRWQWTDQAVANNRVGVAIWDMPDAHYDYFRVLDLPELAPVGPFEIANISIVGGNVVLDVTKPDGANYHVLRATSVTGPYTTNAANQSASQYSEPVSAGNTYYYRLQLLP